MKYWAGWITGGIKTGVTNINNLKYADDTSLMAESKEELKRLLMRMKEESEKAGWTQHSKNEDHGIAPINSVQLLSHVWLFATPWIAVYQSSLSTTNSWTLLKLMFIKLVMPSNRLILSSLFLLPSIFLSIRVLFFFPMSPFFESDSQSIGVSASDSVLPMNT